MNSSEDLAPSERDALAALPRETEPSRLLEERTVRALRDEGLLRAPRRSRAPWLVAAAAAGLVLYLGGVATGQWIATRETGRLVSDLQATHALEAAALVQRTGSAYAQAIAGLSAARTAGDSATVEQGREVALTALYGAANQLVRLTPDDPLVIRILQTIEQERHAGDSTATEPRRVIWF